jgi:hypothetical protein
LAVAIVEYPLDLDGRELGTNGKGFCIGINGLPALGGSGVDGGGKPELIRLLKKGHNQPG